METKLQDKNTMSQLAKMKAAAINKFGGIEEIKILTLPVPVIDEDEVLIKVDFAGVGSWEPFEREGGYAKMMGMTPVFPYVLGSEGAGTIVNVGDKVKRFKKNDKVYAAGFLNPKGGFYAEYVAIKEDLVSHIPTQINIKQAAAMPGVGLTALRGLEDTLHLKKGESIIIFGASGPMGHLAVQLARRIGARVFAIAAGNEGVSLIKKIGAEAVIDGLKDDFWKEALKFAPNGFDAALLTAGGDIVENILKAMRNDGRVAYPNGIFPIPDEIEGINIHSFNGEPDKDLIERFNKLIGSEPFEVCIAKIFTLEQAAEAQNALGEHLIGKIVLKIQ